MQHDLFSSLDSFLSVPAGSGGLLIRDVAGQYRPAEADEVLLAAEKILVERGVLKPGDTYAITCGEPMGHPGGTNMLKVCRVE